MPDGEGEPRSDGRRALAISSAIGRLHHEHYGRGPNRARTIIQQDYVITFLDDIYTQVEKTLIEAGEREAVRETRLAFQRAMKDRFTEAVEGVMGRKVVAFLSQVHFDPDLSQETFVLEPEVAEIEAKA
jgi:uncharacterized protein YbcI